MTQSPMKEQHDIKTNLQQWAMTLPISFVDPLHQSVLSSIDEALTLSQFAEARYVQVSDAVKQDCTSATHEEAIVHGFNALLANSTALFVNVGSTVLRLTKDIVVKIAWGLDVDHLEILRSLQHHTVESLIPKPLGFLKTTRRSYYFQSLVEGVPLDSLWPDLDESHKLSIQKQLGSFFNDLRAIPHNEMCEAFGSGLPRRCKDVRRHVRIADREIKDEAEFHHFLTEVNADACSPDLRQRRDMMRSMLQTGHSIVLTHADLHPRNIMVKWMTAEPTHPPSESDVL